MIPFNSNDFLERLDKMSSAGKKYAKARADREYLSHFRKSKIAVLMGQSTQKTAAMKEMEARAHPEYLQLLDGLREAVEIEEKCRFALEKLKLEVQVFQTISANNRYIGEKV